MRFGDKMIQNGETSPPSCLHRCKMIQVSPFMQGPGREGFAKLRSNQAPS